MDAPKVFTVNDVAGVLGAVPTMFGFQPEESLVAICTEGPRQRFGFSLRLDLPELDEIDAAAQHISGYLRKYPHDGLVLVAFTDRATAARQIIERTRDCMADTPIVVAARADGEFYWDYTAADPSRPIPYADPSTSEIMATAVAAGKPIYASRTQLENAYQPVSGAHRTRAQAGFAEVAAEIATMKGSDGTLAVSTVRDRALAELHTITSDRNQFTYQGSAWLALGAAIIPIRDQLWTTMTRQNAADHADTWRLVAIHSDRPASVAPYTLSAFANWLSGDGAQARISLEHAQAQDPDYTLAHLIDTTLQTAVSPNVWDGFDIPQ